MHNNPDSKVHGANNGAHLGPVGPRWAPCWPHEPCYQGKAEYDTGIDLSTTQITPSHVSCGVVGVFSKPLY